MLRETPQLSSALPRPCSWCISSKGFSSPACDLLDRPRMHSCACLLDTNRRTSIAHFLFDRVSSQDVSLAALGHSSACPCSFLDAMTAHPTHQADAHLVCTRPPDLLLLADHGKTIPGTEPSLQPGPDATPRCHALTMRLKSRRLAPLRRPAPPPLATMLLQVPHEDDTQTATHLSAQPVVLVITARSATQLHTTPWAPCLLFPTPRRTSKPPSQ